MAKTELFTVTDDVVVPEEGVNTFEILDFDTPTGCVIEPDRSDDRLRLLRKNFGDSAWTSVTDDKGDIVLSSRRKEVVISMPGVYALAGRVTGTLLAYTITV